MNEHVRAVCGSAIGPFAQVLRATSLSVPGESGSGAEA